MKCIEIFDLSGKSLYLNENRDDLNENAPHSNESRGELNENSSHLNENQTLPRVRPN
jgi:hypothetical protein